MRCTLSRLLQRWGTKKALPPDVTCIGILPISPTRRIPQKPPPLRMEISVSCLSFACLVHIISLDAVTSRRSFPRTGSISLYSPIVHIEHELIQQFPYRYFKRRMYGGFEGVFSRTDVAFNAPSLHFGSILFPIKTRCQEKMFVIFPKILFTKDVGAGG